MFMGRYWIIVPVLAIAGSLAAKNTVPTSAGTLPTHTPLFISMLVGVIVMIGRADLCARTGARAGSPEHMHLMMGRIRDAGKEISDTVRNDS